MSAHTPLKVACLISWHLVDGERLNTHLHGLMSHRNAQISKKKDVTYTLVYGSTYGSPFEACPRPAPERPSSYCCMGLSTFKREKNCRWCLEKKLASFIFYTRSRLVSVREELRTRVSGKLSGSYPLKSRDCGLRWASMTSRAFISEITTTYRVVTCWCSSILRHCCCTHVPVHTCIPGTRYHRLSILRYTGCPEATYSYGHRSCECTQHMT